MSSEKETMEKIKDMAKLTILSGRLNEIQEKNLKMYPFVFFNGVKSVKMNYDLLQKKSSEDSPISNNSTIAYHLDINEEEANSGLDVRYRALVDSVRTLLWKDIKVFVYFNEKKVHEST